MAEEHPTDVTRLLVQAGGGDRGAADALLPLVYQQLRAIAQERLARERSGHTLQATALVHEAYLRLIGERELPWAGRAHFYATAAEAIRQILIDYARRRNGARHGGPRRRIPLNVADLAEEHDPATILILDEAISRLEKADVTLAQAVRLRFYAGLSIEDTARTMGVSAPTVKRYWRFARAWLYGALGDTPDRP